MEMNTTGRYSVERSGRLEGRRRGAMPPRNTGQTRHQPTTSHLSPTSGITSSTAIDRDLPLSLSKVSMGTDAWDRLLAEVRGLKCVCVLTIEDDRIELDGAMNFDWAQQMRVAKLIGELVADGRAQPACTLLLMCACEARAEIFRAIEPRHLRLLQSHEEQSVRDCFDKALLGVLEHAMRLADINADASKLYVDDLRPLCSPYLLARLALMSDSCPDFWEAYAGCTSEQKQGLMPLVPQAFGASGEIPGVPPTPDLFAWVRQSIEAAFNNGPLQGLGACEAWLNRVNEWDEAGEYRSDDTSLRGSIVHVAVAHALAEPLASQGEASPAFVNGLLERAWASALTLPVLIEVPASYRERLLSAAVEQAANAATTQALDGLVGCYLALCDDPHASVDDRWWLGECLRSAFDGLLAADSGRSDAEQSEVLALRARVDRGLPDRFSDHVKNKRYTAAADCIGEMCLLSGPAYALKHFASLAEGLRNRLERVGLTYRLTSSGLQIDALPEKEDQGLQDIVRQVNELQAQIGEAMSLGDEKTAGKLTKKRDLMLRRLLQEKEERPMRQAVELEHLLSLMVRCGLDEHHPLEALVRRYLESDALRRCKCDEKAARQIRIYRAQTQLAVQTCVDWRSRVGLLEETRRWLDELVDLGAYGYVCLGRDQALTTQAFGEWLEAMRQVDAVSQAPLGKALLEKAVAAVVDGEAGDTVSMVWLFEHFADCADLQSVLMWMPPPVQAGGAPESGVDRLLRIASRLVGQHDWLARMDSEAHRWQPGWKLLLDFCRFVGEQPQPESKPMVEWFLRFAFDLNHRDQPARRAFLEAVWIKALVNGVPWYEPLHRYLMSQFGAYNGAVQIWLWEGEEFQRFLLLMEPHLAAHTDGPSQQVLLRHNLAKGLVRSSDGLEAARKGACPRPGLASDSDPPFAWRSHWATALVTAYREVLSQPEGERASPFAAVDIAALWSAAAKTYPQWLGTELRQDDAVWVKAMIEIFESQDTEGNAKRQRLMEKVVVWRESLLASKAL